MTKREKKSKGKPVGDGSVLVTVDFSEDSCAALRWGHEIASALQAPLLILHVVHDPLNAPNLYKQSEGHSAGTLEDAAEQMMREFVTETLGIDPTKDTSEMLNTMKVIGVPVTRIIEIAEKINARMIVMGSQGRTSLERLMLGSKAEQVVRLSPIPVTIVKKPKT